MQHTDYAMIPLALRTPVCGCMCLCVCVWLGVKLLRHRVSTVAADGEFIAAVPKNLPNKAIKQA